jgi:hypothetical protein
MEPLEPEPWKSLIEFIANHAVARYVLVASTSGEQGKPGMGMVWQHFLDNEIDYSVLRPSWFMGKYSVMLFFEPANSHCFSSLWHQRTSQKRPHVL